MLFVSSFRKGINHTLSTCKFQSRNRDAFRFKCSLLGVINIPKFSDVSISESRCFSFQAPSLSGHDYLTDIVSISESRCFSFQVLVMVKSNGLHEVLFQSRNRDAFRFKEVTITVSGGTVYVSISESRCFSFQVPFKNSIGMFSVVSFQSRNRDAFRFKLMYQRL